MCCLQPIQRGYTERRSIEMVLQNIIFPRSEVCQCEDLYFHSEGDFRVESGVLYMESGTKISFFSYFNAFSVGKWLKYTTAHNIGLTLELSGQCHLTLRHAVYDNEVVKRETIGSHDIVHVGRKVFSAGFEEDRQEGIFYFELEAASPVSVFGGSFYGISETSRNVCVAVGICTFRREEYVRRTLKALASNFTENEDSALWQHLHVFVSDNGNTLPVEELNTEFVHIFPNPNYGGSGGFGRCMLEAVRRREEYGLTHMLLMDDDILLEPESIYRTYWMLSVLRRECDAHCIGGALLRMDIPYIQHACGEIWKDSVISSPKAGYDLRRADRLLQNEDDTPVEYNGWWYCCFPMSASFAFPMPFFIHGDDIEYGKRFHEQLIHLNGIGVWHDAFDNRKSSSMEYYDMRNGMACNVLRQKVFTKTRAKKVVCRHLVALLLKFRYNDQRLAMRGMEDFLKGPAFLREQDPEELHRKILEAGYVLEDVSADLERYNWEDHYTPPRPEELYSPSPFTLWQKITLNGWLLPGKREWLPVTLGAHPRKLFRARKVLLFDPDTKKGIFVKRERKQLFTTVWRCLHICRQIDKKFDAACRDYREHAAELTTEDFWTGYLGLEDRRNV